MIENYMYVRSPDEIGCPFCHLERHYQCHVLVGCAYRDADNKDKPYEYVGERTLLVSIKVLRNPNQSLTRVHYFWRWIPEPLNPPDKNTMTNLFQCKG